MLKGLKKLLAKGPDGPTVSLAMFGKHPGWDDHMEDLGLDTEFLVHVKQKLYVDGIGGNVDTGSWENLDPGQVLDGFDHTFLWVGGEQRIVGRFWSSSDGKGRTKYPLFVCAGGFGLPLGWYISEALPLLEILEASIKQAASADQVRAQVSAARERLRGAAQTVGPEGPKRNALVAMGHAVSKEERELALVRILYQMERELGAYRVPKAGGSRTKLADVRSQHMRVPAAYEDVAQSLSAWLEFVLTDVAPAVPVLVMRCAGCPWVDIYIGDPTAAQFYALRANTMVIPLTSEIPYSIDEGFRSAALSRLEGRSP